MTILVFRDYLSFYFYSPNYLSIAPHVWYLAEVPWLDCDDIDGKFLEFQPEDLGDRTMHHHREQCFISNSANFFFYWSNCETGLQSLRGAEYIGLHVIPDL
jgi:hypothetical protein